MTKCVRLTFMEMVIERLNYSQSAILTSFVKSLIPFQII